jgi:transposase
MRLTTLLPHLKGLRVLNVAVSDEEVTLTVGSLTGCARCPSCHRRSCHIHSHYTRQIVDQPIANRRVLIHCRVRRFRCRTVGCLCRTFAEQVPRLATRYARRSVALEAQMQDIGVTLGGRPGARFAQRRATPIGRTTLLRLVRRLPLPDAGAPTVLGVDDFALRRGYRYGTVLVDLQDHRIVDLLPERTAETVAAWMAERASPQIVCRDRGGAYAEAAHQAAPMATQVADRFHLACNGSAVLERVLARYPGALRAASAMDGEPAAPLTLPSSPLPDVETGATTAAVRRGSRHARYEETVALHRAGWSITAIAAKMGLARPTVRKYVHADAYPAVPPRGHLLRAGAQHAAYLQRRWNEGCHDAPRLHEELQARGFTGSVRMVQRAVAGWCAGPNRRGRRTPGASLADHANPPQVHPLAPRQATWLLLRPLDTLTAEERTLRERLLAQTPAIGVACRAIATFRHMVRTRDRAALDPWLEAADVSSVAAIRAFAASMRRDYAAVAAALEHAWSSGQVEGQVIKIKLCKRQMYGRGKLDLLRRRVLLAS